jgi:D-glycero-alpha-D-manno-heptose-7-phosphate kinase
MLNDGIFQACAPLRVPIAGGGTDLPEYYTQHGGFWISLSIDKKVCAAVYKNIDQQYFVHYKNNETCTSVDEIKHPIIREMLKKFKIDHSLSIHSISELPGNSGLGSSSTFALCLAKALAKMTNNYIENYAEFVFNFERKILNEFVGKQDSWAAYCGGLKQYEVDTNGNISVQTFCSPITVKNLCDHMILIKAGNQREANLILQKQAQNLKNEEFQNKYHKNKEIAYEIKELIANENFIDFGLLVDKHWQNKLQAFNNNFDNEVFEIYDELKNNNATGAKLCGAGNSGFMLAVFEDHGSLMKYCKNYSHRQIVHLSPNFEGAS